MNLYCFDFHGVCLGHIDRTGAFFDHHGTVWANLRDGNAVYDLAGRYRGHVDAQGSFFAEDGRCLGYVRDWGGPALSGAKLDGSNRLRAL